MTPFLDGYLRSGFRWPANANGQVIVRAVFPVALPSYYVGKSSLQLGTQLIGFEPANPQKGFLGFRPDQVASATRALGKISQVSALGFDFSGTNATNPNKVSFGFTQMSTGGVGFYPVWSQYQQMAGDVFLQRSLFSASSLEAGSEDFEFLLHEIGHAIGLDHAARTAPMHAGTPVPAVADSTLFTVMSYTRYRASDEVSAITPMLFDIAQLQASYGASATANGGVTNAEGTRIWTFADNAHPFMEGMDTASPYRNPGRVLVTLWTPSGLQDILDATNLNTKALIDLRPGEFSAIGTQDATDAPIDRGKLNVGIAFNAVLERAIGGSKSDDIRGNHVANVLEGNAGDDVLDGGTHEITASGRGAGDGVADTLVGGDGADVFVLRNGSGLDVVNDTGPTDRLDFRDASDIRVPFQGVGVRQTSGNYASLDGAWAFALADGNLTIRHAVSGVSGHLLNFENGDYGIRLIDEPAAPTTNRDITGDLPLQVFTTTNVALTITSGSSTNFVSATLYKVYPNFTYTAQPEWKDPQPLPDWVFVNSYVNNGVTYENYTATTLSVQYNQEDELGNLIRLAGPAESRADSFKDSAQNDNVVTGAEIDHVLAFRGGDDRISTGSGNDYVEAGAGADWAEGGADSDILRGEGGNDTLWADTAPTLQILGWVRAAGENGSQTGGLNDLLSGDAGDDVLVGAAGADYLAGGEGADIVIGGAGDDTIYGDRSVTATPVVWSVTRVESSSGGVALYDVVHSSGFNGTEGAGASDTIYGGAGDDWIFAGGGDDYVEAGSGQNVVLGGAGWDTLIGGGRCRRARRRFRDGEYGWKFRQRLSGGARRHRCVTGRQRRRCALRRGRQRHPAGRRGQGSIRLQEGRWRGLRRRSGHQRR